LRSVRTVFDGYLLAEHACFQRILCILCRIEDAVSADQ
jgi:hypothetical protein